MGRTPQQAITGELSPSVQRYQLSYIRPYHREIARRLVLGQKAAEIARDMDMNAGRLSIIINSPAMQREVERLEKMRDDGVQDVTVQLAELQPTMIEVCERIAMYGTKETTRLSAAQDLLDRCANTSKVHKVESNVTHETHEQRLARLMGVPEDEIHSPNGTPTRIINVTPESEDSDSDAQILSNAKSEDAREGVK